MRNEEQARFAALVVPYLSDALGFARWLTKNRADAEDVVQEAALRAYKAINTFCGDNPRVWLLAIVRNTAYTWMKKHSRTHLVPIDELGARERAALERTPGRSEQSDPEADLIGRADDARVEAAIASLPDEFREVLVLRDLRGLVYRDIAEVTGVPIGTVMSRLARARERVIRCVQDEPR